jgi:hypothetical protein
MSRIPSITEQELRSLKLPGLDEAFLSRLTSCAEGTATELSPHELDFEALLRASKPRPIPSGLAAKLQLIIDDTPFAVDDKIVLFHKGGSRDKPARQTGGRSNIIRFNVAAAAAVAAMGAIAALMLPVDTPATGQTASTPSPAQPVPAASSNFAPASFDRNLSETHDEGVIWRGRNQPHRVLRLTYTDRVTLTNELGESVQVEQPRVEYVIIPEKID